jgi:scyllo-inositol 2-dehydrogenase (NADP+)
MAELRVALLGYGLAGAVFHGPLVASVAGLRLAVVVTANPERAAQARREHPGVVVLDAPEQVWERAGELDLVVVATPNRTHAPLTLAALAAGLPVVVDKPMAVDAAEGQELVDRARARGLLLTVFQNRRWDGDLLTLRRLLHDGALGRVHRFESRFERWRPLPKPGWRESGGPQEAGGLLNDLGSHLVDQALHLFGPAAQVYGELDRRRPGMRVDDDAFVALAHASGVRSHLWMSAVAARLGPRLRVLGERAAYVKYGLDGQEDALRGGGRPDRPGWGEEPPERWGVLGTEEQARPVRTEPGAYQRFYEGLVAALRGQGPPPVDPADAVAALRVLDAARRSAAEGAAVPV